MAYKHNMDLLFKSESRADHHLLKCGPRFTLLALSLGMLAGCTINTNPTALPKPIREPQSQSVINETLQNE